MARAYAQIGFTNSVKNMQKQMGSREIYQSFEEGESELTVLGEREQEFISDRDSFYQATINENGWPYVQHRGGPKGFLKVLNDNTIAYADFTGNRQYLSVGNLHVDNRVSLILMNYRERQRLKIWGRVRIVEEIDDPELIAHLENPDYRAPIERAMVISVEAYDWNCPKYITPRFSQSEVEEYLQVNRQASYQAAPAPTDSATAIGTGSIPLIINAVRRLTQDITAYEFMRDNGEQLPQALPGSHITVPIRMMDGTITSRSYSLTHIDSQGRYYRIAVKREKDGEGGSEAIHAQWRVGTKIRIDNPKNYFPWHSRHSHTVLIAGGIGITPFMSMLATMQRHGHSFELHYTGQRPQDMAFLFRLRELIPEQLHEYYSRQEPVLKLDIKALLQKSPKDSHYYVCGPARLIDAVLTSASECQIPRDKIQYESFR